MSKKNNGIVKVYVDSREQQVGKKALAFFKQQKIMAEQKELINGDLVFVTKTLDEPVYIERKTLGDLVGSYFQNHIQEQAIRLNEKKYRACVVYGNLSQVKRIPAFKRVTESSINKMIVNLQFFYGLPVFKVKDEIGYFKFSLDMVNAIIKNHNKELNIDKTGAVVKNRPDISLLTSYSNIGPKKAALLLEELGSPKDVLYASRQELLDIKGVGDSLVADIKALKDVFEGKGD